MFQEVIVWKHPGLVVRTNSSDYRAFGNVVLLLRLVGSFQFQLDVDGLLCFVFVKDRFALNGRNQDLEIVAHRRLEFEPNRKAQL